MRTTTLALATLAALLLAWLPARAGLPLLRVFPAPHAQPEAEKRSLVILKDGFVMHGRVKRETELIIDPNNNDAFRVPKGFMYVDDGPRRIVFSPAQAQKTVPNFQLPEVTVKSKLKILYFGTRIFYSPPIHDVLEVGPWDGWNRFVRYRSPSEEVSLPQHLSVLNSFYARANSTAKNIRWSAFYLTSELGAGAVRKLLVSHPDLKDDKDLAEEKRAERRFHVYTFLLRAGWYKEAGEELEQILKTMPAQKTRVEKERKQLRKIVADRHWEAIQRAHRAGRHEWARAQLKQFAAKDASPKSADAADALKKQYAKGDAKLKQARDLLSAMLQRIKDAERRKLFTEAVEVIRSGLHRDNLDRLETFLGQAEFVAGRKGQTEEQAAKEAAGLLALAVTGWLQGNAAAQQDAEAARKLWRARRLVREYLRADQAAVRRKLLNDYATRKDAVGVDEVAQMIALLPPPRAEKNPPRETVERQVGNNSYLLKLPPEYNPNRPYPLLFALPDAGEKTSTMLNRWKKAAGEYGFILAVPEWQRQGALFGNGNTYDYSAAEHAAVLDALIDLRRHFNVDSDRVFLFGLRQGGSMAFDVGLSHPHLFAGVLPMSGSPEYFSYRYWPNGQYLPFYVVGGDKTGAPNQNTRDLFEKWVPNQYPSVYVQYKGRGLEWFGGEVEPMLEWMSRKKRETPATELGSRGGAFQTFRQTDDRFYWVTTEAIHPRFINESRARWVPGRLTATLHARIDPADNRIVIKQNGFKQLTVWLGNDARLNFDKPVQVMARIRRMFNGKVEPSLETLLEEHHRHADRQRLYVAKIALKF